MLAVINVRDKPVLDPVLLRHQPLRYGQSIKADNNRISEETRRTRCSRVSMRLPTISYISFILFLNVFFLKVVFCILDHLQRWLRERRLFQDDRYTAIKSVY